MARPRDARSEATSRRARSRGLRYARRPARPPSTGPPVTSARGERQPEQAEGAPTQEDTAAVEGDGGTGLAEAEGAGKRRRRARRGLPEPRGPARCAALGHPPILAVQGPGVGWATCPEEVGCWLRIKHHRRSRGADRGRGRRAPGGGDFDRRDVRGLLSVTEARATGPAFAPEKAWRLHPQVALRDETFGALAYHYGNRRLVFLKSRQLVELVSTLHEYAERGRRAGGAAPAVAAGVLREGPGPIGPLRGDRCRLMSPRSP